MSEFVVTFSARTSYHISHAAYSLPYKINIFLLFKIYIKDKQKYWILFFLTRKIIMGANNNCQIQRISWEKEKKMMILVSFGTLN